MESVRRYTYVYAQVYILLLKKNITYKFYENILIMHTNFVIITLISHFDNNFLYTTRSVIKNVFIINYILGIFSRHRFSGITDN